MSSPQLHLQTLFVLDADGRILGTREPDPGPGPLFFLIRGKKECAWAVRADVAEDVAIEFNDLARVEPTTSDFRETPMHAGSYLSLVEGGVDSGPAFTFPDEIARPNGAVLIKDKALLDRHFPTWTEMEIPSRTPIVAIVEEGHAVSVSFCSRRTDVAAECGLETAVEFRGRGLGPRVAAGWALAVRASGRTPLYSTAWSNHPSIEVARKLGLEAYSAAWSILEHS